MRSKYGISTRGDRAEIGAQTSLRGSAATAIRKTGEAEQCDGSRTGNRDRELVLGQVVGQAVDVGVLESPTPSEATIWLYQEADAPLRFARKAPVDSES